MNTTQSTTQSTSAATRPSHADTCYLCGHAVTARFSHRVEDRAYAYVWCGRCSFGQYVHTVTI